MQLKLMKYLTNTVIWLLVVKNNADPPEYLKRRAPFEFFFPLYKVMASTDILCVSLVDWSV